MSTGPKLLHRLHGSLMPDYNRAAATYWWTLVVLGAAVIAVAAYQGSLRPFPLQVQAIAVCVASILAGTFPVPLPGTKSSFSAAEIFIFLGLLYVGLDAACLAAAAEAFVASMLTSKRWTSRLVSAAVAAISMAVTGWAFLLAAEALGSHNTYAAGTLLALLPAAAIAHFLITGWLVRMVLHLKAEKPLRLNVLLGGFGWIGSIYAANAFIAALIYLATSRAGAIVLMAAVPMIAMLLTTLHFHFKQREAEAAEARARVEAAERHAAQTARHNEELRRLAGQGTTGLVDHRHFLDRLTEALGSEDAIQRRHAVIHVGFDNFRRIEETLGAAAGEEFLVHVGNRIQRRLRQSDLVGKLGADEFAVLAKDVNASQATELAKRLVESLSWPYAVGGVNVESSASVGIALTANGYEGREEILQAAEGAMREASSAGGRRWVMHQPDGLQASKASESGALVDA